MKRIAVCDDEQVYVELIAEHLCLIDRMQALGLEIFRFTEAEKLLEVHMASPFDAIFLDIDMPGISGFEVAEKMQGICYGTRIIFVTAKHDLVYESFEYMPFYFLCKMSDDKLQQDVSHVLRKLLVVDRQNTKLTIQDSTFGTSMVPIREILYISSEKHYLLYHTQNAKIPYKERGSLASRESEFLACQFIRPHQRYLVNTCHIQRFDSSNREILLDNGQTIPVSRNMREDAFRMYREQKRK